MGSKTRLSSYCTKRANNGVNLVTSRKINTRLARPINVNPFNVITSKFEHYDQSQPQCISSGLLVWRWKKTTRFYDITIDGALNIKTISMHWCYFATLIESWIHDGAISFLLQGFISLFESLVMSRCNAHRPRGRLYIVCYNKCKQKITRLHSEPPTILALIVLYCRNK